MARLDCEGEGKPVVSYRMVLNGVSAFVKARREGNENNKHHFQLVRFSNLTSDVLSILVESDHQRTGDG